MQSPLDVLSEVAHTLDALGIAYVVVGSFASSLHGLYRSTADIDIVADIKPEQIAPLVSALQESFYIDEQAVRRAVAQHSSFNAIHFASVFKVDIFIPPPDGFGRQQLARRQLEQLMPDAAPGVYVATAEDTLLSKLLWYDAGGRVAQAQWADVLGIIGAQGTGLHVEYLREWAARFDVLDLLELALTSAS
jgi:hypothetical protein